MIPLRTQAPFSTHKFSLLLAQVLWLPSALAAPQFVASEIPATNLDDQLYLADMDGDGRSDLLLAHWSEEQGRELYIHLQQPDGRFPALPSRRVEINAEIIGFGTADLRPEPGAELVFVSSTAVYSFSSAIASYSGNLKKLVDWPFIASTPEQREIAYFGALPDLDQDGHADLLLPDDEGFGYFRGQGAEEFVFVSKLITVSGDPTSVKRRNRSGSQARFNVDDSGAMDLTIVPTTSSEFAAFLSEWRPEVSVFAGLLNTQNWIPALGFASIDADERSDLVFINDADSEQGTRNGRQKRQISVLLQNNAGAFAEQANWQAEVDARGLWQLAEFSGDALTDLVRIVDEGTEATAYLYRNKGGSFDLEQPDQVLRFSGLGLDLDFSDLNGDGKPELSASYFSIPVLDAIRNTSIQRSRLIFANIGADAASEEPGPLFSRRPDYKYDENISADNVLGLTAFGNLQVDLDGDGSKDYLQVAGDGTLIARSIDGSKLQIAPAPFWQYVPSHIMVGFRTEELNADARPDIILQHSLHFTVLVSVE